ncbi:MAG: DUF3048 domain-containing protein [Oscillospiraceae bacterium]|jgi:hypothetical protein
MKRILTLLLAMLMVIALFVGCGKSSDADSETEPKKEPETSTAEPKTSTGDYTNPLTGETCDVDLRDARPYCVMLNNIEVAQPQCGISKADIIYEALVEGSCTRMMAIFSDISDADVLGSMRSTRPYYIQLALAYDGILVHAGGSEQAYSDIQTYDVDNIDGVRGSYAGEVFYRDSSRMSEGYEHSLFTTGANVTDHVKSASIRTKHDQATDYSLSFVEDGTPVNGSAASNISVSFDGSKTTTFTYNEAEKTYTSAQFNSTYTDGNNDVAPQFTNVLILFADVSTLDDSGRRAVDLETTGTGYFACGGASVPIQWSHGGVGENFRYTLSDGSALNLGTGKTYVCIVPNAGGSVTMQ